MVKTLFTHKESRRGTRWQKSPLMDKLLGNEKIAGALNEKREKRQFYDKFKGKFKGHKVTTTGMKNFFYELKQDKDDTLSDKEVKTIARQVFKSGKKYLKPISGTQRYGSLRNGDQPIQNKINSGNSILQNVKSTSEKIRSDSAAKISVPMIPENFFNNSRTIDKVMRSDGLDRLERKKSIYDVLEERKRASNQ